MIIEGEGIDLGELEFKECDACAKKPGMPTICQGCLHNRRIIYVLKKVVDYLQAIERERVCRQDLLRCKIKESDDES